MLDEGLTTDNGVRSSNAAERARAAKNPTGGIAGQYISPYTPRYDVLSPDVAVTSSGNDFARIGPDSSQGPTQVALMTIVWKRTDGGWRVLYYHESTRPKELKPPAQLLSPYTGNYLRSDGSAVQFTVVDGMRPDGSSTYAWRPSRSHDARSPTSETHNRLTDRDGDDNMIDVTRKY